tara:strand:+ start:13737 stop:14147 length:411 start_codon:yes stop_codon:yes gene_type:complete
LPTKNSITAAGKASSPNARMASGKPMLPELLNIMGGTKIRLSIPNKRPTGHANKPEPNTTMVPPTASNQYDSISNDLLAKAENTSAGTKISMFSWLANFMSGFFTRPYQYPRATTANTGKITATMRKNIEGRRTGK